MFLFLFVFSIAIQLVSCYGNNECIDKNDFAPGFFFSNCEKPAEIAIKWRKENYLFISYETWKKAQVSTTLVINDQCTLKYEINDGHFKWTDETGKEVDSHSYFHSDLNFHGNGTLTSWDNKVTMCENKSLVNSLDDEWVWTKVRVIDLFDKYGFFVYLEDGKEDEGTEIVPPTTSTVIESTTTEIQSTTTEIESTTTEIELTTTESIKNDTSIQTVELGRLNLIIALVGVFFGFIAMSCSVALFMFLL